MIQYPYPALPRPSVDFSVTTKPNIVRTKFDDGYSRQRLRFTADQLTFSVSWLLDDEQHTLLRAWLQLQLTGGMNWFTIQLPYHSGFREYQARIVDGELQSSYTGHMHWQVSAKLETRAINYISQTQFNALMEQKNNNQPNEKEMYTKQDLSNAITDVLTTRLNHEYRVVHIDDDYAIQPADINAFFVVNTSEKNVTISIPNGTGFNDSFIATITKVGKKHLSFKQINGGIALPRDDMKIANSYTTVSIKYINNNKFQLYGDIY